METFFRGTGLFWGEFTYHRWIPVTKASYAELLCFLWSAPEQTVDRVVTGLEKCLNFSGVLKVLKKCLIFYFALKMVIFPGKVLENDNFILEIKHLDILMFLCFFTSNYHKLILFQWKKNHKEMLVICKKKRFPCTSSEWLVTWW